MDYVDLSDTVLIPGQPFWKEFELRMQCILLKLQNQTWAFYHRRPKLTIREIDRINDLCKRMNDLCKRMSDLCKRIEWDVTT